MFNKKKGIKEEKIDQLNEVDRKSSSRRLSIPRLLIMVLVILGITYYFFLKIKDVTSEISAVESTPWFAPYVDVTATPQFAFESLGNTNAKDLILSFIVSSEEDPCIPSWGKAYTMDEASTKLDLDRRVARLRQLGGDVAISFGGLLNDELAVKCTDTDRLYDAYKSVIDRYSVNTIDLDIEGEELNDTESIARRAETITRLQQDMRNNGESLAVWLTLPVTPQGLLENATNAIAGMLASGLDLSGVNIMTMDYGESRIEGQSLQAANERALLETHRQLGILYSQAGIYLNDTSLWKKIGATPMIGQNDIAKEVFSLEDARALNEYVLGNGIIRTSMWSINRDVQCGDNYVNLSVVSDSCSGVTQDYLEYSSVLSVGLSGSFKHNGALVTEEDEKSNLVLADDPTTSPYQIWQEDGVYLQGTKVVWHGNVYEAKWWTQGELPDNPVLQSWQTPWKLIGPVLPGEKPVENLTLPDGTYPNWSGTTQYNALDRVLFNGVPYKAKWWTQGDSPAASTSNPTSSPWVALTQEEVEEVLGRNK